MSFEQPQAVEQDDNNLEKPTTKVVGGSLDGFLEEVAPEGTSADRPQGEAEKEAIQERNRQAKDTIQPLIDKFQEARRERASKREYLSAQRKYAALSDDKERYKQLHDEDINNWLAEADLYEQALNEYHDAGGEGDLQGVGEMHAGTTREEVLSFEKNSMGGADGQFERSKESLAGKYDKQGDWRSPNEVRATTPSQYITNLESNAAIEAGNKNQFENRRREWLNDTFGKTAQGFGIEALSHGDVVVAARSLALAEAVGEIPEDVQEQMKASYKNLDEAKKAEFIIALKRERENTKQRLERALAA